jgi:hypothetical protein
VAADGPIVEQSGGISVADNSEPGLYFLDFGQSTAGKSVQVTPSCIGDCVALTGKALAARCGGGPTGAPCDPPGTNNPNHIAVVVLGPTDDPQAYGFWVSVF